MAGPVVYLWLIQNRGPYRGAEAHYGKKKHEDQGLKLEPWINKGEWGSIVKTAPTATEDRSVGNWLGISQALNWGSSFISS